MFVEINWQECSVCLHFVYPLTNSDCLQEEIFGIIENLDEVFNGDHFWMLHTERRHLGDL